MLTTYNFNSEDILVDKLKRILCGLPENERHLIDILFSQSLSEREFSAQTSILQKAINDRKNHFLIKLRKIFEKIIRSKPSLFGMESEGFLYSLLLIFDNRINSAPFTFLLLP